MKEPAIDSHYFWICVALLAIGTIAIRGSIIALADKVKIPERSRELFSYIPAAILPAIVTPMVLLHQGHVEWLGYKERSVALALSTFAFFFSRNMVFTVLFGLLCLHAITHIHL